MSIVGIHLFCAGLIAYPSSLPEGVESSVTESTASEVVPWFGFEPIAIDADGSDPVTLVVQTNGLVTHLDLVLASGAVQQLDDLGNGLYSTEVRHEDALFGYAADDVNRNFVGFLDVYDGEARLVRGNMFIDVYDATIPEVAVSDPEPDIRVSRHIVNLHLPGVQPQQISVQGVARRFYEVFPDHFDFINVVSIPSYFGNRYFSSVRNSVTGIGRAIQDFGSNYGSAERLQGYVRFPISTYFDLAERAYSHELGHNWINFLFHPKLQGVAPHWPISSLASGIMGFQTPTNPQGLDFPFHISDQGDGSYLLVHRGQAPVTFNGMDLYLMGLAPPDQAGTYIVFENQQQAVCAGCVLQGPVQEFSTQDVIEYEGARSPAFPDSQRAFRSATIVVTESRKLSDREMHLFDHFAARGESIVELPYAAGFAKGTTYPFFLATLRKAALKTSVLGTGEFIINAGLSDAWYQPATAGQGFLITVFPGIQQVFLAWFTFDVQRPPDDAGATLGEPGHRWLTAQGPYGGATANLAINLTRGGLFDSAEPPAVVEPEPYGSTTLEFADCNSGLVTYDIPSLGLSGAIPIERIALDNLPLCELLASP